MMVALSLSLWSSACAQETILVVTGPQAPVTNGAPVTFWLNVLNQSDHEVSWKFPPNIACRLVSAKTVLERVLILHRPVESGAMVIRSGAFAREEYLLTVDSSLMGQVIVEFPDLDANPVILNLQRTTAITGEAEKKKRAALTRFIQEGEPEGTSKPYDPGRFFKEHISGYEPMYFLVGSESPDAKFQLSFKYQLLNRSGWLAEHVPLLMGLHLAYTQTSLWDLNKDSAPFFDSSYRPEFLYALERVVGGQATNWFRLDLQVGLEHESNGKGGADSRSLNLAYLRPKAVFGYDDGFQLTLQPEAWVYVGNLDDNPDLPEYLGHGGLRAILGWQRGLQLSAIGRLGDTHDHYSVQLDLTYPLMRLLGDSFSLYLQAQYFTGYGESLLEYDQRGSSFRIGFGLYR
jgi:outer membrane phospholipase A